MDIQPIISMSKVTQYIAKYAAKAEPRSEQYDELLGNIIDKEVAEEGGKKAIHKLLIRTISERDISAQECCHHLMGFPLYHSSRQFVTLNVLGEHWERWSPSTEDERDVDELIKVLLFENTARVPRSMKSLPCLKCVLHITRKAEDGFDVGSRL